MKNVTDATFEEEVLNSSGVVLVDVWAEWCAPCRQMGPVLNSLADQYGEGLTIAKVDADANPETVERMNVRGIPTLAVFVNGKEIQRLVGAQARSSLDKVLGEHIIVVR